MLPVTQEANWKKETVVLSSSLSRSECSRINTVVSEKISGYLLSCPLHNVSLLVNRN